MSTTIQQPGFLQQNNSIGYERTFENKQDTRESFMSFKHAKLYWRRLLVQIVALPLLLGIALPARSAPAPDPWIVWLYGATSALYNSTIPSDVRTMTWDIMPSPSLSANWHEGGGWLGFWVVTGGYYGTQVAKYAGTSAIWYTQYPIVDTTNTVIGWSDIWYCVQSSTPSCTGGNLFEVTDYWSGGSLYWRTYIP